MDQELEVVFRVVDEDAQDCCAKRKYRRDGCTGVFNQEQTYSRHARQALRDPSSSFRNKTTSSQWGKSRNPNQRLSSESAHGVDLAPRTYLHP